MKRGIFIALGLLLASPAWADHHESLTDNSMGDEASLESAGAASMPTGSVGRATSHYTHALLPSAPPLDPQNDPRSC